MLKRIRISPLYFLMAAVMIIMGYGYECLVYTVTVIIHELSHAEVASRLGYKLNKLRLMPYGASLTGEFESAKWSDEILIAIAGPLSNLVVAVVLVALWWLAPVTYFFTDIIVWANFFTAIFNLLPVYPMDGGRILLAALSKNIPRQKAYKRLKIVGFIFCGIFIALFVLSLLYKVNISFAIIAVFMLVSTVIDDKSTKYQRLYQMAYMTKRIKKGIIVREVMISGDSSLLSMMRQINSNYYYRFLIVDENMKQVSSLSEAELEALMGSHPADTKIIDAIRAKNMPKK